MDAYMHMHTECTKHWSRVGSYYLCRAIVPLFSLLCSQQHLDIHRGPVMLVSTLNGTLYAVSKHTGTVLWALNDGKRTHLNAHTHTYCSAKLDLHAQSSCTDNPLCSEVQIVVASSCEGLSTWMDV